MIVVSYFIVMDCLQSRGKIWKKLGKLRKGCNHKWNINGVYIQRAAALQVPPTIVDTKT